MEEWRTVKVSPTYEVSSLGNVRSTNFNNSGKTKLMSQYTSTRGYKQVGIMIDGDQKICSVHRLVATAFIPNPKNLPYVNHIDGNKCNNNASNLEWITNQDNQLHGFYQLGHHGLTKPILCVETGTVYESARQAGRELHICPRNISQAAQIKHRVKSAGGYHWKRLE